MPDEQKPLTGQRLELELGTTGLTHFSGFIEEEFLKELQGPRGMKTYREMGDNDAVVKAALSTIEMMIRQVAWDVQPASEDAADKEAANFLKSCMDDMSDTWPETISEILSMLTFGFSAHEIVYKRRLGPEGEAPSRYNDGRIGWKRLPIRAQETVWQWDIANDGAIKGLWQQAPPLYQLVYIPVEKLLLFRTTSHKANPEGKSLLRGAYRAWYFKKHIENIEGIGIERDLTGLPTMWVPAEIMVASASPEDKATLARCKDIVRNVRRDEQEGLVLPLAYDENGNQRFKFELLSTGGRRQFETNDIVARYNQAIAMSMLSDFILLGHEGVGSFALSSDKTSIFTSALDAWLDSIASVLNRFAVPRLFRLNNFNLEALPKFVHGEVQGVDLKEIADYILKLSQSGMMFFPDEKLEKYLRDQGNLPITGDE